MSISIFLTEDDPLMGDLYARAFKLNNLDFKIVSNGEEVINTLKSMNPKPDIILLDVMMPKKSGFDVLSEIKEDQNLKDIPVILLTNLEEEKDKKRGLSLGAESYLVKSRYGPKEIVSKIKEICLKHEIKSEV